MRTVHFSCFMFTLHLLAVCGIQRTYERCECSGRFPCLCVAANACFPNGTINYKDAVKITFNRQGRIVEWCEKRETCCRYEQSASIIGGSASTSNDIPRGVRKAMCGTRVTVERGDPRKMETAYGEFPWTATLFAHNNNQRSLLCGASLVTKSIALISAHCVFRFRDDLQNLGLEVGIWNLKNISEESQVSEIAAVYIHPKYANKPRRFDVALIKLVDNLKPDKAVRTVCLPPKDLKLSTLSSCVVTGWGVQKGDSSTQLKPTMKQVKQIIRSRIVCDRMLQSSRLGKTFHLENDFICAGTNSMKTTCQVIPGSPLVCEVNGRFLQMGISSWNVECGKKNLPGVYVNVKYLMNWIKKTIKSLTQG